MSAALDFIVIGLAIGAVYALLALPLSVVFSATREVDIAVGAYAALAGLVTARIGLPYGLPAALAVGFLAGLLMAVIVRLAGRRTDLDPSTVVLLGLVLLLALTSASQSIFGVDPHFLAVLQYRVTVGTLTLPLTTIVSVTAALVSLLVILLVLFRTNVGRNLRAVSSDAAGAEIAGINVRAYQMGAFALGGMLAALAGVAIVITRGVSYSSGLPLTIAAFGALIVLGMKDPRRAVAGGFVLGLIESMSVGYLPDQVAGLVPYVFILAVLSTGRFDFDLEGVRP